MMKTLFVLIAVLVMLSGCSIQSEPVATREIKFNVAGMYCDGCVKAIDQRMNRFEGAQNVSVTLEDSTVIATFPESKIPSDEELQTMLEDMGYSYIKPEETE
jgi:copper chaperone CopZ